MALEDIAGYSLRRKLGSGSVGTVWLVRDRVSGRNTVLKRVPMTAISDPEELREHLTVLQRLDHPHLARLQEIRETGTGWLLFSQYVVAGTLTALLSRRGPLTDGELVTLLSPLAEALDSLHRAGLTHGRVTAANIMFDADGRPVLTDAVLHTTHPTAATDDLTALATVAHLSGGDPTVFTSDLFTAPDPHDVLALTTPVPINLAFTQDPTPDDDPTTTNPPPRPTTKPSTADEPPHLSRSPLAPPPEKPSSPHSRHPAPPKPPPPKPIPRSTKPTRRKPRLPNLTRRAPINSLTRLAPQPPVTPIPALSPTARRRRRWRRRSARWRRSTHFVHTAGRRFALGHPAYGVLAAVGLGAAVVLILGLFTVGILDNPVGTAAAADRTERSPSPLPSPSSSPTRPQPARVDPGEWTRTLEALDTQRAQAFWTLDLALLDTVYVPGTKPWSADRALLATYRKHQIRVRGLQIRIDQATIESQSPTTVVLRTVDHLTGGQAIDPTGTTTTLPPGAPTTRRITLTTTPRASTPWRITAITAA